jgi:hypothetical protein
MSRGLAPDTCEWRPVVSQHQPSPLGTARPRGHRRTHALLGLLLWALLASAALIAPASFGAGTTSGGSARGVRTVSYPKSGVEVRRASGDLHKLAQTSPSFRTFTRHHLTWIWGWTGKKPACAQSPLMIVKRWRSDGWALINDEGSFPPPDRCATGGNWAIAERTHGKWREALGGQEYPTCRRLSRLKVPVGIAYGGRCYNAASHLVTYQGP